ncbi:MAG: peptide ABC transporter permease [Oceanicaulis sp.]|uniref:ABC transporter permease n=1 Tax=unclassified Oceanicaulis TaxID=2632123 RepID=UPI000C507F68|nr:MULTISPECIES: ABC transporter permease [unclassified Oceanicaulis]MBC40015.1 peptide ABC transporter permease [Oceanicaulis sp.]HBU62608.1 peptide ABC transporter permease [Oceanicaulis sp.]HCR93462.1 peptide ABC transporter permease [Oceanicaulis sp.]
MFSQIAAVTSINLRSIPQRWGMSLATILSIALVVGVLLGFLAMANGFRATVNGTGSESIAVLLRSGSQAELNSGFGRDTVRLIETAPGIARDADGAAILSAELYVITDATKRSTGNDASLSLRGVDEMAPRLRENFQMVEGRMFAEGSNEIIVGEGVIREFSGFNLGETIRMGPNEWRVVGVFSTGGSVFDSEIWADVGTVQNLYNRGASYQSIRVRLDGENGLSELQAYAENEPRLDLDVTTEKEFFAQSAGGLSNLIMYLGWPLAIIMAVGALAGAWNAMYASVDSRVREIATLRTLGFSGFAAFVGTLVESLMLAFIGGLVGALITYFVFDGVSASTMGGSFTQVVFSFAVTIQSVISGVILALVVGLFGGFFPALRASRVPLLEAHG